MSAENPYAPPGAKVADPVLEIPATVFKKIKTAWIAGLISGGLTLAVTLVAMFTRAHLFGFSAWQLADVALIFGLTFGIYKKSRTCAMLMFIYFIISKIFLIAAGGQISGLPLALVFGFFFWQGISGTFAYHKLKKRQLQA